MNPPLLKSIIEAALLSAGQPLNIERLQALFPEDEQPATEDVQAALDELATDWEGRSLELKHVSSGYRFQVRTEFAPWLGRLSEERQPRYSRALLETLALIVYRQPITRAGIEEIRGVTVSSHIIRTLLEREWVRVVGHRDVPGKPALYGTTRKFLDYFNLRSLSELPTLADIKPIDLPQESFEFSALPANEDVAGEEGEPSSVQEIADAAVAVLAEGDDVSPAAQSSDDDAAYDAEVVGEEGDAASVEEDHEDDRRAAGETA
ncbi:MAG: SMC-Scp complex subunit ScpB [Chromatiales bacterium]|jgi:segregation and condensation protein B|nr:SMC-Scp complex subunit ScpB [Chromatiales bacterium]